ncbi:secreted hydrolase [Leifsonia xyli subsp. cynodontis DSM 46306]|uniref:SGNH hydrolase-type esterase domain-containing protein n=1 Tax=Leifsonia xyli subsp. cynodontis DSM 46306 TaxID=1389489 RepID=U3P7K6_LEIXC|nr:SGNH/GDSL hydrolase family protein [Leifsonia xyli]AGW41816.1 secreted hydrolase [Leifsonia xyli subsp. cynodontis DSM 46306]
MRNGALSTALAALLAATVLLLVSACSATTGSTAPAPVSSARMATPTPSPDAFPRRPLTPATRYVALGDSFAAGMGGGGEYGKCRRSPKSYPDIFTRDTGVNLVVNAACAGATTADLLKHQLIALDDRTELVTLSIGGNDLGVAAIAVDCAAGKAVACRNELSSALSLLNVLPERLATVYNAVAEAAPNARIVVTGYALLYDNSDEKAADFGMATAINAATLGLNQTISDAVEKQDAAGLPLAYIGVDFTGHGIGSRTPWISQSGPDAFHPTADGYGEYARELVRLLGRA